MDGSSTCPADSLPVIGANDPQGRSYSAFGHQHVGLTGAPKTGRLIAELIFGARPNIDLGPFDPSKHKAHSSIMRNTENIARHLSRVEIFVFRGQGRLLIRKCGAAPLIRAMVGSEDQALLNASVRHVVAAVAGEIGKSAC